MLGSRSPSSHSSHKGEWRHLEMWMVAVTELSHHSRLPIMIPNIQYCYSVQSRCMKMEWLRVMIPHYPLRHHFTDVTCGCEWQAVPVFENRNIVVFFEHCSKMHTWNKNEDSLGNAIGVVCKWISWRVHNICKSSILLWFVEFWIAHHLDTLFQTFVIAYLGELFRIFVISKTFIITVPTSR